MDRLLLILSVGLVSISGAFAATATPVLRSATVERGYIRVVFSLPQTAAPSVVEVGLSRRVGLSGAFLRGVRLRERIAAARTDVVRWRTREALTPGRYYVHVSTTDLTGVIGCFPHAQSDCPQTWSNVLSVLVPRKSA